MALAQLAGPFTITYQGGNAYFLNPPLWYDGLGLVGTLYDGSTVLNMAIVGWDGIAVARNKSGVSGSVQYNPITGGLSLWYSSGSGYYYEDLDTLILYPKSAAITGGGKWTVLSDRYIYAAVGKIHAIPRPAPSGLTAQIAARVTEYTFSSYTANGGTYGFITPSPRPNSAYVCWEGGDVFEYNVVTKTQVGIKRTVALLGKGLFYSPSLGTLIYLSGVSAGTQTIRVFSADDVVPATLTAPAFSPAATIGKVSRVTVQLKGAANEPCIGWPVDWALTGDGTLSAIQSITDTNGQAAVDYICPPDASGAGNLAATVVT